MVSPAALSIILTTFAEGQRAQPGARRLGRDRRRRRRGRPAARRRDRPGAQLALGLLRQRADRRGGPRAGAADPPREPGRGRRAAATTSRARRPITLGTMALVFTLIKANDWGWGSARTLAGLAVAAALLVGFVWIERRHENPLVPLRIFSNRSLAAADATMLLRRRRALRRVLLLHAVPAAGARLQRAEDRRRLPAAQPHAHRQLRARLARRRPLHAQAGARRRAAHRDGRASCCSPACRPTATTPVTCCPR